MRRRWLLAAPAALGACSILPARPYLEKRSWPLEVRRPNTLPPRPGGPVLLVRTLRAAPGLEARGLQIVQSDGSIRTDFYEEWSVPPADAVEDSLRRWLAGSGLFSAVLAPGSRARADLALEGELQSLLATPAQGSSRAALGLVLLDLRPSPVRVLLQADETAEAALTGTTPADIASSSRAAVARLIAGVEARLAGSLPGR
ncbi:ABC-type transport auxiliary lipoprotein family protein [Acidisphaera sp. L21]|uniref:ABC-type transport auxiliary lipoprotein family protein n=1 Tax=Acidisphaera sp. L21 TaxID=1641851 RepID=UPI00131D74D6|nr:ABC-type transport auxiliary lipoprotein family protein [Acidisphaera sp. L21]